MLLGRTDFYFCRGKVSRNGSGKILKIVQKNLYFYGDLWYNEGVQPIGIGRPGMRVGSSAG